MIAAKKTPKRNRFHTQIAVSKDSKSVEKLREMRLETGRTMAHLADEAVDNLYRSTCKKGKL